MNTFETAIENLKTGLRGEVIKDAEAEVIPGIRLVAAAGHTPGHTFGGEDGRHNRVVHHKR